MILLAAILCTFQHYGVTWDEETQALYGKSVLRWYGSGFRDGEALGMDQCLYGGAFEVLASTVGGLLPFGLYENRHLVNAAFGSLAVLAAYGLGLRIAGAWAGLLSALFLACTPIFYGHLFNNPKDIPFAALFAGSLWALVGVLQTLPSPPRRRWMVLGLLIGLTLGVRIGGVLLLAYALLSVWFHPSGGARSARAVVVPGLIAWGVMLVFWPWALVSPIRHPLEALAAVAHFHADWSVLFDGRLVSAEHPPLGYLPIWFSHSLPEFYFIALLAGAVQLARRGWSAKAVILLLLASVIVPVAAAITMGSTLYDGVRHFLFVVPPLSVLAGVSLASLPSGRVRALLVAPALLSVGLTVADMVALHPYQSVYFNRLMAGGLPGAAGRFETDYWGSSYKEGVDWVIGHYRPPAHEKIRIANCSNRFLTGYYLEKSWELRETFESVGKVQDPHVFLATTNRGCHEGVPGALLHVVERQGVPLCYVFELRRPL